MTSTYVEIPALDELWRAGPGELVEILRMAARGRNQLDALLGRVVAEVESRGVKASFGYGSTAALLDDVTHIGYAAAKRVLARAVAVSPSHEVDGAEVAAVAPLTGVVAAEGVLGAEQVEAIVAVLKDIPASVSEEDRAGAEKILVDLARDAGPREITRAGCRLLDTLDPDGPKPKDPKPLKALRELHLQPHRDGTASLRGTVDPVTYATMRSVLDPLAKPHPATPEEGRDSRSQAERLGDALAEAFRLAMTAPELPTQGGDRAHIVVTMTYEDLRSGVGKACLDVVGDITAAEARLLACDARVIPMVLGSASEPLDLGRMHRFVSPGQRRALAVRDGGCAYPGCHRKPRDCDAHHVLEWVLGGATDLGNLTLLCSRHHRLLHHSDWEIRMAADGKPDFIPPSYFDPLRRPRRNTLHDTAPLAA